MGGRFYRPLLFSMASDGCGPGAPLATSSRAAAAAGAAAASLASEAAARGTPGVSPEQQPWARLPSLGSLSSLHSSNGAFQVPSRLPAHTSDSLSRHDPGPCAFPHRPRGSEEPRCFHLTRRTSSRQLQAPRGNSEWQTQAGPSASWPPPPLISTPGAELILQRASGSPLHFSSRSGPACLSALDVAILQRAAFDMFIHQYFCSFRHHSSHHGIHNAAIFLS